MSLPDELHYDDAGLVPAVLQDQDTREVLTLAYMDRSAVQRTLESGLVHFWSRSRQQPWLKGESSGRVQHVVAVRPDCESNSLLVLVRQEMPGACHTGHGSCFYRQLEGGQLVELSSPLFDPIQVYRRAGAQDLLKELLGAYSWLGSQELLPQSGTSRALHGEGPDLLSRVRDEWGELVGVLEGTHVHEGFEHDVLLEAYQVLYWTCLYHVTLHSVSPEQAAAALSRGYGGADEPCALLSEALHTDEPNERLKLLWAALGAGCREGGIRPERVVRKDLDELRGREYMAPYFAGAASR